MKILQSRAFLIALMILLLNDLIFKYSCPNWLTGKLSDFTGLFVFPLFWAALFPKYKKQIFYLTAMLFLIWKSPLVDPLLAAWNALELLAIHRVVDYSDYWALLSIPLAYYYWTRVTYKTWKLEPVFIVFVSSFAFIATSPVRPEALRLDFAPMVVFEIDLDSLPEAIPLGIMQKQEFNAVIAHHENRGTNFFDYYHTHFHKEGPYFRNGSYEDIYIQDNYLLLRQTGLPYFPHQYDLNNFLDRMDLESEKKYYLEGFKDILTDIEQSTEVHEGITALVLIYDSLVVPRTLTIEAKDLKRIDRLSLDIEAFDHRYELSIKHSMLDGAYAQYYPSGQLKQRGYFKEGILDGIWEHFDKDNNVVKTDQYEEGNLIAFADEAETKLSTIDQRRNAIFWYNILCLIGMLIFGGYIHYRIVKTWWKGDETGTTKSIWNFISNFFISGGACIMVLIGGSILVIMWISLFKETSIFVNRIVPYLVLLPYLFIAFLFFFTTRKHYNILFFILGFFCVYFISNEIYYLAELNK